MTNEGSDKYEGPRLLNSQTSEHLIMYAQISRGLQPDSKELSNLKGAYKRRTVKWIKMIHGSSILNLKCQRLLIKTIE